MPDEEVEQPGTPRIEWQEDGQRLVTWSVAPGKEIRHRFPDAVKHHYRPGGVDEDVPLYRGQFKYSEDDRSYDGDVRFRWRPSPRIEIRGERSTSLADGVDIVEGWLNGDASREMWVSPSEVVVALPDGELPAQPGEVFAPERSHGDPPHRIVDRLEQQLGEPSALDQVTFLVPNGWEALDGTGVCDPDNLTRTWRGRGAASGDGWSVTIDRDSAMTPAAWRELKDLGGHRFTHVGRLARLDGSTFTGDEAFVALDRVRLGLNLALGRRTTCALPVGWGQDRPVWSRWRSAPVDTYRNASHWLDETICCRQIGEIVSLVLSFTADEACREAVRHATAYYVAANVDVDVELSTALPISGLQLLSYFRFVTQRGTYSRTQWESKDNHTEHQLRLLLDDLGIDTSVPDHFAHLVNVQNRLARQAPPRDALGVVVKMRNVATHPTRGQRSDFSIYEWAEAGMLARYWLCLALLNTVGYQGEVAAILGVGPRWTGQLRPPPWVS